uniref:ZC3H15/TMA46 family C-terminal domain-containing protein n=1 Tax=Rhodosorus marinus TaxID=101924 RepID=A0A7S2ZL12_9RHOD|mmetsp:Transcript_218/g.539  ORF Transcript_218/g.539 Transcript_218/m.539 type:complete len:256 (+) Transcript_218:186-953(+)|eukprot:CAMPEP_0113957530 /NCGR_PEP_ID=MMETSP0011_2-20120614/2833_1 /TAXON_ID=101924 /ORGANISM="Rhodosorus marinus" /LENGTH=255 /DNA_ID=CAMNT_0000968127 /DNA_START=106 /DNA_END=873 /DNA_ORIENTATION=+ /assembly_acc=CAM_ASM_000156
MPPKSKKEKQKETKKLVEDKTFGLKNKNKSKKVQQYVSQVEKQAQHKATQGEKKSGSDGSSGSKLSKKQLLEARMAELNLVYRPVKEKEKKMSPEEAEKKRIAEEEERERLRIASLPVEDQIEEERAKLKTKTPVTLELFLAWKEKKAAERITATEKKVAAAKSGGLTKHDLKKGGLLTGRELFEYNREVFVDDANADDEIYERDEEYRSSDDEEDGENKEGNGDAEAADEEAVENADDALDDAEAAVGDESLFS